jgi:hypothetical protein
LILLKHSLSFSELEKAAIDRRICNGQGAVMTTEAEILQTVAKMPEPLK